MSPTIRSLVVPVSDLNAAKAVYSALLGSPHTDESYYVGYNINGFEVGLNPAGGSGGPVAFADVEDLDAAREPLLAAGATEHDAPHQVAPGTRICVLADPDGNPIGLRGKQPTAWPGRRRARRRPGHRNAPLAGELIAEISPRSGKGSRRRRDRSGP